MDTIKKALYLHEKYRYSYYDSLILASALENGCKMIFTEDLQNGQVIEKTLKVVNIFI
jgi:predicted nucleic acid-binding protein